MVVNPDADLVNPDVDLVNPDVDLVNPDAELKPEINGRYSKKRKKNNLLQTKKMLNAKIQAKWGPWFYI